MAEQADEPQGGEIEEQLIAEGQASDGPQPNDEKPEIETDPENPEPPEGEQPEDEFDEFTFGDEAAPASRGNDSDLARHLRSEIRKRDEELAAYRSGKVQPAQPQVVDPGPKPTLEGCEFDADKFEADLLAWNERKREADQAHTQAQERSQAEQQSFAARLQVYGDGQKALKVPDFEVAEAAVLSGLSQVQQATLIIAADDPAKMVYALGRHPEKLKTLSAITNPIEFTKAAVKLEGQLKVARTARTPPDPDRPVRGDAPLAQGTDKTLERLEREAARTGDRTQIRLYRKQQREKAQGK